MSKPTRPTSGIPAADRRALRAAAGLLAVAAVAFSLTGCNYSLQGGSFPEHIRTVAVLPFENETTRLELTQELHDFMTRELPRALGVRVAAEDQADAVVQGTIIAYDLTTPNFRPTEDRTRAEVLQRQVRIGVRVEIIDRVERLILWDNASLRAEGTYLEQTETEDDGKLEALELLVQRIVDGAQSNW